jgi:hypothetical protein
MPPATSHRAWALARLAQIREVADERRRWADVQQRQLQPADVIDAAQVAREAEAARLEDARLQARQQRHAASLAAAADTRARARAKRRAQAEAPAVEATPVVAVRAPHAGRRWDRAKQRWVKERP